MAEILRFNSGSKVLLIDGKMFLSYGKKLEGNFLISFEDIYKNVFLNEDTFVDSVIDENGIMIINRLKDYDGEVFINVENISQHRKSGNVYSVSFDVYESLVIRAIATSIMS